MHSQAPKLFPLLVILLSFLSMSRGMDLTVDANLASSNGNSYPSLSSAIDALLQEQNLTEANNSITLLASCVNVTQYFPNNTVIGPSAAGGGTLKISFIDAPSEVATSVAITDQSICNTLPTITFSSNSTLNLEYLDSFSVEGVNIQHFGATMLNRIHAVGAVNFSHICWQSYEPSFFLDSSFQTNFTMDSITRLSISDGIFLYDTLKTLSISGTSQVSIDSFVFVNLDLFSTYQNNLGLWYIFSIPSIPAVAITSDPGYLVDVTISNLQITCISCNTDLGCWTALEVISVNMVDTIEMSSITIPSCQLTSMSTVQNIFVLQEAKALIIDDFAVVNLQMQSFLRQQLDMLIYISAIRTLTVSNLNFTDSYISVFQNKVMFFYISDEVSQGDSSYYPMTMTFTDWVLDSYSNYVSSSLLNCTFEEFDNFGGGLVQNIFISDTYLTHGSYLININVQDPNGYTWNTNPAYFTITNLTLIESTIEDQSAVGYFNFYGSTIIEEIEITRVIITSLNSTGNIFASSYFFQIVGMGAYLNNSVIQGDQYNSAGYFYFNVQTISSLIVSNLTTSSLDIQSGSGFILAQASGQRSLQLLGDFQDWDDPIPPNVDEYIINYVETRPFIITDSTFIINSVIGDSQLLTSTNPQVIIERNIFQVSNLVSSNLLSFGSYKIFNGPGTNYLYPGYPGSIYPAYPSYYMPFTLVETSFFENYQDLYEVFLNARTLLALYDPINPVFFISVQQNLFTSIQGQNVGQLISLVNFEYPQATIGILNNTFENISSIGGGESSSLIFYETIYRGVLSFNSLSGGDLNGYFFQIQSDYIESLSFVANTMNGTIECGFYSIQAPQCDNITIQDGGATNSQTNWTFISIECNILTTQIVLTNESFQNIARGPTAGYLAPVDFIFILNDKLSSTNSGIILLEDISFENVSLSSNQFATQSIYGSSLIFVLTIQATTVFTDDTFINVSASPSAGLITLSAPAFFLNDSNFQNVTYGSVTGAINVISSAFSLSGCIFEGTTGFQIDGAGLLSMTNLDPSNPEPANVSIFNCTFINNVAPYGTIFYTTTSSLILVIDSIQMINNQVTEKGALIYFFGGSNSQVLFTNSTFIQNKSYSSSYPALMTISFDSTGAEMTASIENCNLSVTGPSASGAFISISALLPVTLVLSNSSYSAIEGSDSDSSGNTNPMFGLFKGDNFKAQINYLQAVNVSLNQTTLFTVDCNSGGKISSYWELIIDQSVFSSMTLSETIMQIASDGSTTGALNNLTILIQNTNFSDIFWLSSTSTQIFGNIINSLSSQLGRDSSFAVTPAPCPSNKFAISIQNSSFESLSGSGSLIFATVESSYSRLLLVNASNFSNLYTSSDSGGLFNPSTSPLSSDISQVSPSNNETVSHSLVLLESNFSNVTAQDGCILYWQSAVRGFSTYLKYNNLQNISCSQNGGIIYANYYGGKSTLQSSFITDLERNSISNVTASNGGILFFTGETRLLQVNITENMFQAFTLAQNGGLVFTTSSSNSTTPETQNRLLSSSQENQTGVLSIIENQILDITASNGGIIYDTSDGDTINFLIQSNSFTTISALERGGGFFVTQPIILNITNNSFTDLSAGYVGNLVFSMYAVTGATDFTDIQKNNTFVDSPSESSMVAFGPTNLLITFISIQDGSILPLENANILPYFPTMPNLTSYSLSEYYINFTLIYLNPQADQIVFDESQQTQIGMNFTSLRDDENSQKYIGHNCSNSICSVSSNDIILKGLAEDVFLVDLAYTSENFQQAQQFQIVLRSCIPGEINQTDSEQCLYCKPGTFSLVPTDPECIDCPEEATCNGGVDISIKPGFYRSNSSTTTLVTVDCNDTDVPRCNGGLTNQCKEPFTGPVCLQCDKSANYVSSGKVAECNQCYDKEILITYAIILVLATVCYQILMIYVTYNDNKSIHEQEQLDNTLNRRTRFELKPGQFMVVFSTFNQLASTFANLDVGTVTSLLGITENVGNSNSQVVFSLRCLYQTAVPDDDFAGLRFQVLLYVISPLAKVAIAMLFEFLRILILKSNLKLRAKLKDSCIRIGAVVVVLVLLEQPGIVGILCAYLSCQRLDPKIDQLYIEGYNTIQCYTDRYSFFSHLVVIPALIWWTFVVPLIIFFALYKNRERLHKSLECRLVLGNFYNSYSQESFYWGLVVISLKIIIFVLNSVLTQSQVVKAVVFIIIIHVYYMLLKWRPPFPNHRLMNAEKLCCFAYLLLLTLVLFRISIDFEQLKTLCSILILISIAFAGAYIIINLGLLYIAQVKSVLKKLQQKKQDKKTLVEILKLLEEYQTSIGSHRDRLGRRCAITLDVSQKMMNKYPTPQKEARKKFHSLITKQIISAFSDPEYEEDKESAKAEEKKFQDMPNHEERVAQSLQALQAPRSEVHDEQIMISLPNEIEDNLPRIISFDIRSNKKVENAGALEKREGSTVL